MKYIWAGRDAHPTRVLKYSYLSDLLGTVLYLIELKTAIILITSVNINYLGLTQLSQYWLVRDTIKGCYYVQK